MNAHNCFWFFRSIIFNMAYIFLFTGLILFWVTKKIRYSISVCPNNDFSILHLSLFPLIFCSVSSNFPKGSYQPPLEIISRTYKYASDKFKSMEHSIDFSWNFFGELQTPIGRRLYLYFPHGGIILHMTCSSPRHPLSYNSLVCSKNYLFIVGIGPIRDKEL